VSAATPLQHGFTVPGLVAAAADRFGDGTAVLDRGRRISYAELGALVETAARGLIASGVEPGDRVCVWAPNVHQWVVAALAAQSAGAELIPLNTRFTGHEALDILERTRSRVLFLPDTFLGRDYLATLRAATGGGAGGPVPGLPRLETVVTIPVEGGGPELREGVVAWADLLVRAGEVSAAVADERASAVSPDSVCDILFTSGTTGRPKGAMSSHRQTLAVADAWAERAEVEPDDRYLIINPFFHSFGYKAGIVVCLLRGAAILPQLVFDIDRTVELVERERVTILPGPPTIYQTLLEHPGRGIRDLSSLRLAVTGSAIVPVALIERMRSELSFSAILTAYGLSEAVVATMCLPTDAPERISRTSGCATAGFEIRIMSTDGDEVRLPTGSDGEIQLRGPNVMLGYLDDPEATRSAIDGDGWFRTGDIGNLDEHGYLAITDRLKDMYTVGGFNVYPAEVEEQLARLDGVVECAVVGVPDQRLGSVGKAYLVIRPGGELGEADVLEFCRERLANFKVPRFVEFLDALPRSAAGKVVKHELRDDVAAGHDL
jgi:HIP---CoA ligase